MNRTVHYEELAPREFRERLGALPVAYLPLGTLEWHGEHLPLGTDAVLSQGLMVRAAERFGGIVLPPLFLGPDRARREPDGSTLIGMDYDEIVSPPRQLDGSAYHLSDELFTEILHAVIRQLARAGFRAIFADGHGPSRTLWTRVIEAGGPDTAPYAAPALIGAATLAGEAWPHQTDHAGQNETALLLYYRGELARMERLDEPGGRLAVEPIDPQSATDAQGQRFSDQAVELIGRAVERFRP